jgi:hypothetical protein
VAAAVGISCLLSLAMFSFFTILGLDLSNWRQILNVVLIIITSFGVGLSGMMYFHIKKVYPITIKMWRIRKNDLSRKLPPELWTQFERFKELEILSTTDNIQDLYEHLKKFEAEIE